MSSSQQKTRAEECAKSLALDMLNFAEKEGFDQKTFLEEIVASCEMLIEAL